MKYIGEKLEGKEYIERNTAYGLILNDDGKIAIGIEHGNMYNMIGGQIEYGEDAKEALNRESIEETGYGLKNMKYLYSLACYLYVDILDKYELAQVSFYSADIAEKIAEPIEKDIKLVWVKPEEVVDKMYFEYHRYFLKEYIKNKF